MWESKRATSLLPAGWMAAVSLTVAALTVATAVSASPVEVLIGRGDVLAPFAMSGGELNLSTATVPWSGLPFLNLSYDFTKGGWGANLSPEDQKTAVALVPDQQALAFGPPWLNFEQNQKSGCSRLKRLKLSAWCRYRKKLTRRFWMRRKLQKSR